VGQLPVIAFERIERAAERLERTKSQLAYIDWAGKNPGSVIRLVRSLITDAEFVPREVIIALEPIAPLLTLPFADLRLSRDRLARELIYENTNRFAKKRRILTSRDEDILQAIWRAHWAVGHATALAAESDRTLFEGITEGPRENWPKVVPGYGAMRFGFWPTTLRACWAAARMGHCALKFVKPTLADDEEPRMSMMATLVAAFVGAAHNRLRAEARKVIAPRADPGREKTLTDAYRGFFASALLAQGDDAVDKGWDDVRKVARDASKGLGEDPDQPGPYDLAMVVWGAANRVGNVFTNASTIDDVAARLGWYARLDLHEFYLPETAARKLRVWQPEKVIEMIRETIGIGTFKSQAPARAEAPPGRNTPCPCGSGAKYKRCCGA
jgi:hypothetical protein